ncbi:CU044_5270 family protein [Actinacidiphila sp. bgisy144]|uniref:CU044_5270 family protein n=1 Tax=unclassified Actinacidiphila TaxID=2995708 RepID=UPI003EB7F640
MNTAERAAHEADFAARDAELAAHDAELAALRAMLPPPATPGLTPTRRTQLEAHLMREVADGTPAKPANPTPAFRRRLTPTRSMSLGAAAAVVAATVIGFAVTGGAGQTAVAAAPAPLKVEHSRPTAPLATVAARAAAYAATHSGAAHRGTHRREWALGMWDDGKHQPEQVPVSETRDHWNADGSAEVEDIKNGKVVHRTHKPAGTWQQFAAFRTAPPDTVDALADVLAQDNPDTRGSAYWTMDATEALLREWTPGPALTAAIDGLLARQSGVRALGPVEDRAGRQGQAYAVDFKGTVRWTFVLDEYTGRILGTELSSIRTDPKLRLKPGDVEQYDVYLD